MYQGGASRIQPDSGHWVGWVGGGGVLTLWVRVPATELRPPFMTKDSPWLCHLQIDSPLLYDHGCPRIDP